MSELPRNSPPSWYNEPKFVDGQWVDANPDKYIRDKVRLLRSNPQAAAPICEKCGQVIGHPYGCQCEAHFKEPLLAVKGPCAKCGKLIEVRSGEAWHAKNDKVWHEICSYQSRIEELEAGVEMQKQRRAEILEEAAQEAEREASFYETNLPADDCSRSKLFDLHAVLACKAVALAIRALSNKNT